MSSACGRGAELGRRYKLEEVITTRSGSPASNLEAPSVQFRARRAGARQWIQGSTVHYGSLVRTLIAAAGLAPQCYYARRINPFLTRLFFILFFYKNVEDL